MAGGSYEVEIEGSKKTSRAYIGDYAIMTRSTADGIFGLQYIHRDRLGSVDTITNGNTQATLSTVGIMQVEQRTYNAFGKARTATGAKEADGTEGLGLLPSESVTPRGFTNHEHLGGSGLVHMNGRAYDPELGRFLSVDPFITFPENGQSLNPYSYVMNNPLKYTDPSGYTTEKKEKPKLTLKERNKLKAGGATGALIVVDSKGNRTVHAQKSTGNGYAHVSSMDQKSDIATSNSTTSLKSPTTDNAETEDSQSNNLASQDPVIQDPTAGEADEVPPEDPLWVVRDATTAELNANTIVTDGNGGIRVQLNNVARGTHSDIREGVRRHEQKHIEQFNNTCTVCTIINDVPAGQIVAMRNATQASRNEVAASATEIDYLNSRLNRYRRSNVNVFNQINARITQMTNYSNSHQNYVNQQTAQEP